MRWGSSRPRPRSRSSLRSTHGPRPYPPHRCSAKPSAVIAASLWRTASTNGERTKDAGGGSGQDGLSASGIWSGRHATRFAIDRSMESRRRGLRPFATSPRPSHDLACPRNAQRSVFRLERDDYVPPGVPRVADDAVLKIERCDRQGLHGAQRRFEVLPERALPPPQMERRHRIHRLVVHLPPTNANAPLLPNLVAA